MLETTFARPSLKRKAFGSPPEQAPKRLAATDSIQPQGYPSFPGQLAPVQPHQPIHANLAPGPLPLPRLDTQHVNIQPKLPALGHAGASTPIGPPAASSA